MRTGYSGFQQKVQRLLVCMKSQPAFSLMKQAQRKSLAKRKRHKGISPPAGGDKGYAPLTAPPFEKGG
ncbi:MAG: hypothetical protein MR379_01450, partial [Clostridiales bacterium]|nr:hypothetical protein [Clostridiales bacterium]